MNSYDVLIVGSGHGGVSAASTLRHLGFAGTVAIISADRDEPYERPPLSKDYLTGDKDDQSIHLKGPDFWRDKKIELILGETVSAVDASNHLVTTASGREFTYRKLIWAAGGEPRRLTCDGRDLAGVHTIRARRDVDALRAELGRSERIVVIGGGYIGLEAAASLTKLGKHVTIVEALDRLLARVAGPPISAFFLDQHLTHGVDVRLGAAVSCIEGMAGRASEVLLADGTRLPADIVIVGIGIEPHVAALAAAGAEVSNGVAVDEHCRTTLPDIYAVGDCALHRNSFAPNQLVRIESVQNAVDQGAVAAHDVCGDAITYTSTPWFWSNQYELKLQTVGLNIGYDETVIRGDPASGRFSVIYLRAGHVAALDCVNSVKDYVQGRALVERRAAVERSLLSDQNTPLKALAPQE
ncbi:MAG TPA: FAD-dependent oxidoreductase [Sphingomicrobium sp.]|nr:FAD-dependent oxidoreductase [Sphingomicrobium sp.]